MDALDGIHWQGDSTVLLAAYAQEQGHKIFYYQPNHLSLINHVPVASLHPFYLDVKTAPFYQLGKSQDRPLTECDIVLMRQDPPFNMRYLSYTYLLEKLPETVLVVNRPGEVRNLPEKIFPTLFPDYTPPTLISEHYQHISDFKKQHKDIIVKPLYAHGGADIYRITENDSNFSAIIEMLLTRYQAPLIAQSYLPEVMEGDKRVILIDGEVAGAINRVPPAGEIRSNMIRGGKAEKTTLTPRQNAICEALKPELKKRGIFLAGIDLIGDYLTEINTTSPTGLATINQLYQTRIEAIFWEKIIEKLDFLKTNHH